MSNPNEEYVGIEWIGQFDNSGYGIWGRRNVELLQNTRKYMVRIVPNIPIEESDPFWFLTQMQSRVDIRVWNLIPTFPIQQDEGYCTVTELGKPPDLQIMNMNNAGFVISLGRFATEVFKAHLDDPEKVFQVNFPIPRGIYRPDGAKYKLNLPKQYKFKFLFVGRIDVRKNLPDLIKAFTEEFGKNDDVCLILKIGSGDHCIPKWLMDLYPSKNIFWLEDNVPFMAKLYRSVNAYICTDLGEGWAAPCSEAMLSGIPTIAPAHSGHLDYMTKRNSWLIKTHDWSPIGFRSDNLLTDLLPPSGLVKYPRFGSIKGQMRLVYEEFKDLGRKQYIEHPKIKKALSIERLVNYKLIAKQLDVAFSWIMENIKGKENND